jgi:ADP-heptose:LPS heptosyltransferase
LPSPQHILVIRFSAMGDVAITVPVLKNALEQNPHLQITVVSNAFFEPLFAGLERCSFHPAHLKTTHKGATGIYELFRELVRKNQSDSYRIDAVADLHSVLRSSLLRTLFTLGGYKTAVIDKGRKEKTALTRKENKILKQLPTSFERYAQVLRKIGINVTLNSSQSVYNKQSLPVSIQSLFQQNKKVIGIAPFAQHKEKMYPLEKMKTAVQTLAAEKNIILFGGGAEETALLNQWSKEISNTINAAGSYSFDEELSIISNLDAMISMDSANMHLASLYNVPVISVWGATHPFAGFYGWGQDEKNIVSVDLHCRPCSVFGNKPCWRGDHACMMQIEEKMIIDKIIPS